MTLGTRIAVLRDGRLEQFEAPRDIYRKPASRFVAEFIGRPAMNTLDGEVRDRRFHAPGLSIPVGERPSGPVVLGIRPEQIEIVPAGTEGAVPLVLDVCEPVEPDVLWFLRAGDRSLIVRGTHDDATAESGRTLHVRFPVAALHWFDPATGARRP